MNWEKTKVLVTGGAGFIGSHIVDELVRRGAFVTIYDNHSTGKEKFYEHNVERIKIIKADILDTSLLTKQMEGMQFVFHLAANADVRGGIQNTIVDMRENVLGTHSVLQAMKNQGVGNIAFSSSATVYGEPNVFPTPEHNELIQTSVYGASKLAGEAFIEAFCNYYDITSYIFRFVSWIGERYTHGVVFDFAKKLLLNPHMLPILGDGTQKKSYLYVADGVSGIFSAIDSFKDSVNIFNLGHSEYLEVSDVAKIIIDEMGLNDVELAYAGGNRGWKGDSPFVHLDTSKIRSTGWLPNVSIEEGLRRTVRYLLKNSDLFTRK